MTSVIQSADLLKSFLSTYLRHLGSPARRASRVLASQQHEMLWSFHVVQHSLLSSSTREVVYCNYDVLWQHLAPFQVSSTKPSTRPALPHMVLSDCQWSKNSTCCDGTSPVLHTDQLCRCVLFLPYALLSCCVVPNDSGHALATAGTCSMVWASVRAGTAVFAVRQAVVLTASGLIMHWMYTHATVFFRILVGQETVVSNFAPTTHDAVGNLKAPAAGLHRREVTGVAHCMCHVPSIALGAVGSSCLLKSAVFHGGAAVWAFISCPCHWLVPGQGGVMLDESSPC